MCVTKIAPSVILMLSNRGKSFNGMRVEFCVYYYHSLSSLFINHLWRLLLQTVSSFLLEVFLYACTVFLGIHQCGLVGGKRLRKFFSWELSRASSKDIEVKISLRIFCVLCRNVTQIFWVFSWKWMNISLKQMLSIYFSWKYFDRIFFVNTTKNLVSKNPNFF